MVMHKRFSYCFELVRTAETNRPRFINSSLFRQLIYWAAKRIICAWHWRRLKAK